MNSSIFDINSEKFNKFTKNVLEFPNIIVINPDIINLTIFVEKISKNSKLVTFSPLFDDKSVQLYDNYLLDFIEENRNKKNEENITIVLHPNFIKRNVVEMLTFAKFNKITVIQIMPYLHEKEIRENYNLLFFDYIVNFRNIKDNTENISKKTYYISIYDIKNKKHF